MPDAERPSRVLVKASQTPAGPRLGWQDDWDCPAGSPLPFGSFAVELRGKMTPMPDDSTDARLPSGPKSYLTRLWC
jgi:hypothetical protein